jgi:Tfp pilus assembly protein PilX
MIAARMRRAPRLPRRERGVVLMIALIVLVALTLAGLSMVRTVETGSVIAGNFAFRQAALSATDAGVEAAFSVLNGAAGNGVVATAPDTQVNNKYYPVMQATDANGMPQGITWSQAYTLSDVPAGVTAATVPTGYDVRFVIERMCAPGAVPVTDLAGRCVNERTTDASGGSVGIGRPRFTAATKVNYRITVRVEGPRNTVSVAQSVLSF